MPLRRSLFIGPLLLVPGILFIFWLLLRFLPWPELEQFQSLPFSREYLDRYGEIIYLEAVKPGDPHVERRLDRSLQEFPPELPSIFLKAEDSRFFLHPGIDPLAVLRTLMLNSREGRIVSGASTVTMQLAGIIEDLTNPSGRKGLAGKVREAIDALRLEIRFGKNTILQMWLNAIPFGFKSRGAGAASFAFFDAPLESLSREEMLLLSVIPRRPESYDPVVHPQAALRASWQVGQRLDPPVSREGLAMAARGAKRGSWENRAPHFIRYISSLPDEADGTIHTSLDLELNRFITRRIDQTLEQYSENRLGNAAALVVENSSGQVLAWVGSRNFHNAEHRGEIDGVLVPNQPGSTLKPFLYAMAIEAGFLPNTILPDIPLDLGGAEVYQPVNFDRRYRGPVRLRVALASSLNVPAVYLISRLGVQPFADYLADLGFHSILKQRDRLGTGLALGNAEVSLLELVRAYTIFSRVDAPVQFCFTSRENPLSPSSYPHGREISGGAGSDRRAYAVSVVRDILGDPESRIPGFGPDPVMNLPYDHLFKTGTANQFQNIWALGAVPEYTVGIWVGNFTGETVIGETGSSIPASLVAEVLTLLRRRGSSYPPPYAAERRAICSLSGMAATDIDTTVVYEWLPAGLSLEPCTWHTINLQGERETRLPDLYQTWAESPGQGEWKKRVDQGDAAIRSPVDGARFFIDPSVPLKDQGIRIEAAGMGFPPYQLQIYKLLPGTEASAQGAIPGGDGTGDGMTGGELLFRETRDQPLFFLSLADLPDIKQGEYLIQVQSEISPEREASSRFEIR